MGSKNHFGVVFMYVARLDGVPERKLGFFYVFEYITQPTEKASQYYGPLSVVCANIGVRVSLGGVS
jgi:hypothetical protein